MQCLFVDFGFLKLDTKTVAGDKSDVEFKTAASHNVATGKLFGTFDVKYKIPNHGMFLCLNNDIIYNL